MDGYPEVYPDINAFSLGCFGSLGLSQKQKARAAAGLESGLLLLQS